MSDTNSTGTHSQHDQDGPQVRTRSKAAEHFYDELVKQHEPIKNKAAEQFYADLIRQHELLQQRNRELEERN